MGNDALAATSFKYFFPVIRSKIKERIWGNENIFLRYYIPEPRSMKCCFDSGDGLEEVYVVHTLILNYRNHFYFNRFAILYTEKYSKKNSVSKIDNKD